MAAFDGAVVVVPTRNRAAIAVNAIRSVLTADVANVDVLVSDNSTSDDERRRLDAACAAVGDPRLAYVRPPRPLPMTDHWEWALKEALSVYDRSHFLFLTDRMMFRRGGLEEVLQLASAHPDRVLIYNHDRIADDVRPIRIQEYAPTGKLLEVDTDRFLWLYSQCTLLNALPRMLNCVVPRSVLDRMRDRFGSVFASICPDFSFCCRVLDMEQTVLFYDKSPMFHYALDRSNGASVSRGELTPDSADFAANLSVDPLARNYATPIPELATAHNAVFNEYLIHRNETQSPRFPEMNMARYLEVNAYEVREIVDPATRAAMFAVLVGHGYEGSMDSAPATAHGSAGAKRASGWERLRSWFVSVLAGALRMPHGPSFVDGVPQFDRVDDAVEWARKGTLGGAYATPTQHELLLGREVPSAVT